MNPFQTYLDEDSANSELVTALRSEKIAVVTVLDVGLTGASDEEQLVFATKIGCVLYSANLPDFFRIHTEWMNSGREPSGLILVQQQRYSVGEQLGRIRLLSACIPMARMRNRVEFLSNWG